MFAVDTNVLIYAANRDTEESGRCLALIEEWRGQSTPWFITWSTCYEFLRVATHPNLFKPPWTSRDALNFLQTLSASPALTMLVATHRHTAVLRQTLDEFPDLRGSIMHNLHIAVLMREHGISRIVTRDLGFHRFPFLTVVDPLRM